MSLITVIARRLDGLPLAGKMEDVDPRTNRSLLKYQKQAKFILRKLELSAPTRLSIATDAYLLHYLVQGDVCYLTMCAKAYPRRDAFYYLELLRQQFESQYGTTLPSDINRPYAFVEFDIDIQRLQMQDTMRRRRPNAVQAPGIGDIEVRKIRDVLKYSALASEYFDDDIKVISQRGRNGNILQLEPIDLCLIGIGVGITIAIVLFFSHILEN